MNITELEREDSRGNGTRRGSMSQDINHFYFHNIGESVGGDERRGYGSQTSPYTSCHLGYLG